MIGNTPSNTMIAKFAIAVTLMSVFVQHILCRDDPWIHVHCNQVYKPDYCNYTDLSVSLDEMDRCAPALLEISTRNYFLAAVGRKTSYKDNKDAFDRVFLKPKILRDVSQPDPRTFVLGKGVDFPVGLSPIARHKLVVPVGEKDTVRGLSGMRTVLTLSSLATTKLEEVAREARATGGNLRLWMQVYIFLNRSATVDLVQRAERSGFEAIVLTVDSPVPSRFPCDRPKLPEGVRTENGEGSMLDFDPSASFEDIRWLQSITKLPVIAKGILSGEDARKVAIAGASAVLVSNHGGRQLDGNLATIDALPEVVRGLRGVFPSPEVYLDGGVRSGHDVFKALARGARMVFIGRPQIWGLAYGGSVGVKAMMTNLIEEFVSTMQLSGVSKVFDINTDLLAPSRTCDPTTPSNFQFYHQITSSKTLEPGNTEMELFYTWK